MARSLMPLPTPGRLEPTWNRPEAPGRTRRYKNADGQELRKSMGSAASVRPEKNECGPVERMGKATAAIHAQVLLGPVQGFR